MAFIPIPDTALLVAQFQDAEGVLAINRHYLGCAGVPTETDLQECASAYTDWFTESFVAGLESNWTLTGVVCRAMNEEFGLEFVATEGVPQNGEAGTGRLPNQVTYTVTWLTGLVGRSFRGRTYAVGLSAAGIATGQKRLTSDAQSGLQGVWSNLLTVLEDAGHAMTIVSLYTDGAPRETGVTTPVLSGRVNFPLATQRRRLR